MDATSIVFSTPPRNRKFASLAFGAHSLAGAATGL